MQYRDDTKQLFKELYKASVNSADAADVYEVMGKYADNDNKLLEGNTLLRAAELNPTRVGMRNEGEVDNDPIRASTNALLHKNAEIGAAIYQHLTENKYSPKDAGMIAINYVRNNINALKTFDEDNPEFVDGDIRKPTEFFKVFRKFQMIDEEGRIAVDTRDEANAGMIASNSFVATIDRKTEPLSVKGGMINDIVGNTLFLDIPSLLAFNNSQTRKGMYRDWEMMGTGMSKTEKLFSTVTGLGLSVIENILVAKATVATFGGAGAMAATSAANTAIKANKLRKIFSGSMAGMALMAAKGAYQDATRNNAFSKKYFLPNSLQKETYGNEFINSRAFDIVTYALGSMAGSTIEAGVFTAAANTFNKAVVKEGINGAKIVARKIALAPLVSTVLDTGMDMTIDLAAHNFISNIWGGDTPVFTKSQRQMLDYGNLTAEDLATMAVHRLGAKAFSGVIRNAGKVKDNMFLSSAGKKIKDIEADKDAPGMVAWYDHYFAPNKTIQGYLNRTIFRVGNLFQTNNLSTMDAQIRQASSNEKTLMDYMKSPDFKKKTFFKHYMMVEKGQNVFLSTIMDMFGRVNPAAIRTTMQPLATDNLAKLAVSSVMEQKQEVKPDGENLYNYAKFLTKDLKADNDAEANLNILRKSLFNHTMFMQLKNNNDKTTLEDFIRTNISAIKQKELLNEFNKWSDKETPMADVVKSQIQDADKQTPEEIIEFNKNVKQFTDGNITIPEDIVKTAGSLARGLIEDEKAKAEQDNLFKDMFPTYGVELDDIATDFSKTLQDNDLVGKLEKGDVDSYFDLTQRFGEVVNKLIERYANDTINFIESDAPAKTRARQVMTSLHKIHVLADAFGYKAVDGVHKARVILETEISPKNAKFLNSLSKETELVADKLFAGEKKFLSEDNWVNTMFKSFISRANQNRYALNRLAIIATDPRLTRSINLKFYATQKYMAMNDTEKANTTINEMIGLYSARLGASAGFHMIWDDNIKIKSNGVEIDPRQAVAINGAIDEFANNPNKYSPSWTIEDDTKPDRMSPDKLKKIIEFSIKKLVDHAISLGYDTDSALTDFVNSVLKKYNLNNEVPVVIKSDDNNAILGYDMEINYSKDFTSSIDTKKVSVSTFAKSTMNEILKQDVSYSYRNGGDTPAPTYVTYKGGLKDVSEMLSELDKSNAQGFNLKASIETIVKLEGDKDSAIKSVEAFIQKTNPTIYNDIAKEDRTDFIEGLVIAAKENNFLSETISFGKLQNEITYSVGPIRDVNDLYDVGDSRVVNVTMSDAWMESTTDPYRTMLDNYNAVFLFGVGTGMNRRLSFVEGRTDGDRVRAIRNKVVSMLRAENEKTGSDAYGQVIKDIEGILDFTPDKKGNLIVGGVKQIMKIIIEARLSKNNDILKKLPVEFKTLKDEVTLPSTGSLIVTDLSKQIGKLEAMLQGFNIKDSSINSIMESFDGIKRSSEGISLSEVENQLRAKLESAISGFKESENKNPAEVLGALQALKDDLATEAKVIADRIDESIRMKNVSEDRLRSYEAEKTRILDEEYENILRQDYEEGSEKGAGKYSDVIVSLRKKINSQIEGLTYTKDLLGIGTNENNIPTIATDREALEFAYSYLAYGEGMLISKDYAKRGGIMPIRNATDQIDSELSNLIDNHATNNGGFNIVLVASRNILGTSAGDGIGELPPILYNFWNSKDINGYNTKRTFTGAGNNQKLMFVSNKYSVDEGIKYQDISDGESKTIGSNDIVIYMDELKNVSPEFLEDAKFIEALTGNNNGNGYKLSWDDGKDFIKSYLLGVKKHASLSSKAQQINYSPQMGIVDPTYNTIVNQLTDRSMPDFDKSLSALDTDILKTLNNPDVFNRLLDSTLRKMNKVPGVLSVLAPMRGLNSNNGDLILVPENERYATVKGNQLAIPNRTNLSAETLLSIIVKSKSRFSGGDKEALIKYEKILRKLVEPKEGTTITSIANQKKVINNALDILSKGKNGRIIKDSKGRYWITFVRFPAQGKGQTAPFLIQGIRRIGVHKGVELSPTFTQTVQHTDYDGDRANSIPVGTELYRETMRLHNVDDRVTIEEHIVGKALDDMMAFRQYKELGIQAPKEFNINKTNAIGIDMASGMAVAGLDGIPFYRYLLGEGFSQELARIASQKTIQSVNELLNKNYKDTKTLEPYQIGLDGSLAGKDAWALFDGDSFEYDGSIKKTLDNIGKGFYGAFRTLTMSKTFTKNKKQYKLAYATSGRADSNGKNYFILLEADQANFGYKVSRMRIGTETVGLNALELSKLTEGGANSTQVNALDRMATSLSNGAELESVVKSYGDTFRYIDNGEYTLGNKALRVSNVEGFNISTQNPSIDNAKGKGISYLYHKYYDGNRSGLGDVIKMAVSRLYASRMIPIDRITEQSGIVGVIGELRAGMQGEPFLEAAMGKESAIGLASVINRIGSQLDSGSENTMSFRDFQTISRNLAKTQMGDEGIVNYINTAKSYTKILHKANAESSVPAVIWRGLLVAEAVSKRFGIIDTESLKKLLLDPNEASQFVDANGMLIASKDGFSPALELGRLRKVTNILDHLYSGIGELFHTGIQKYIIAIKNDNIIIDEKGTDTAKKLYTNLAKVVIDLNRNNELANGSMLTITEEDVRRTLKNANIIAEQQNIAMEEIYSAEIFNLKAGDGIEKLKDIVRDKYEALTDYNKTQMGLKLRELDGDKKTNLTPDRFVTLADNYLGLLRTKGVKDIEIHKTQAIFNALINFMDENTQSALIARTQGITVDVANVIRESLNPSGKVKYSIDLLKKFNKVKKSRKFSLDAMYLSPNKTISDKTTTQLICT